jgi:hypothetical protein
MEGKARKTTRNRIRKIKSLSAKMGGTKNSS